MKTPILDRLRSERIFSVERDAEGGGVVFTESCDHYFSVRLAAYEVLILIEELRAVVNGEAEETP